MVLFRTLNLLEVGSGFGSDRTLLVPLDEIMAHKSRLFFGQYILP